MVKDFEKNNESIEDALYCHIECDHGIWYIPEENTGELRAAASTVEDDREIVVSFIGSYGDYLGLQLLKSIAEYALSKNLLITLFPASSSESYYLRLGFKRVDENSKILSIKPEDLLRHPDYFPDKT